MGSIDVSLPFGDILEFYFDTTLSQKTLQVKTLSKTHRFIGSDLDKVHQNLISLKRTTALAQQPAPVQQASSVPVVKRHIDCCFNCSKPIKPSFKFCPFCRTQLTHLCPGCKEIVDEQWLACPFCNADIKKS